MTEGSFGRTRSVGEVLEQAELGRIRWYELRHT